MAGSPEARIIITFALMFLARVHDTGAVSR